MKEGKVFLVGAGPGDPELVTLKAKRLIETCDALVYDYLVNDALLDWVKPDCESICVGKRAGFHSLPQGEIEALLVRLARGGQVVVRLKGGDPFVFGRGGEEALSLRAAGVGFEVVPAVTAALGCAAYVGIPLTHRATSAAVTFLSGHEASDKASSAASVDWKEYAATDATLVLYMAMARLPEIVADLIAGGRSPATPAAAIQWGTTPQQRSVSGTLEDIADRVKAAEIGAPAVVIVGEVARFGDTLAWFDPGI